MTEVILLDELAGKLCEDMIHIIREQRHDFLNHFQVVLGYLQINKIDRAESYIKQVNGEMAELSNIVKLDNPYLAISLLQLIQKSKSLGIDLSFQIEHGISIGQDYDERLVNQLSILVEKILHLLNDREEDQWMEVTLQETIQEIIWVIECPPFLPVDVLMHQLPNHLDRDLMEKGSLKGDQWLEQIRLVFSMQKNN